MTSALAPMSLSSSSETTRSQAIYKPLPTLNDPFVLNDVTTRNYKTQYANIYFTRLLQLRPVVAKVANAKWSHKPGNPKLLKRILNVERTKLCYIIGTIYMEMPLKPNVLEDMGRDHWITAPPARRKIYSPEDVVHLEDESGRVTLVGKRLRQEVERPGGGLVTGVVMSCLGMENASGDFEVVDICFAGLPPLAPLASARPVKALQTDTKQNIGKGKGKARQVDSDMNMDEDTTMDVESKPSVDGEPVWVALISGLSAGSSEVPEDLKGQLMAEWLMGELGGVDDQLDGSKVARVILAGNSLSQPVRNEDDRKPKRYGYHSSSYTSHPTATLDTLLTDLLSSGLPVHVVPGPEDPVGSTLPQQPFPRAMLRNAAMGGGKALTMETNPCWFELGEKSFLGAGGQTLDDIYKYLPSDDRLSMAKRTLEWRHIAPTAPDTLWCFPFSDKDPFIIDRRPNVYFLGNQPDFRTALVGDPDQLTRIVLLPRFSESGLVTLVNIASSELDCKTISFGIPEWERKTKIELSEEEVEAERARTAVVRSDLDLMNDEGEGW